MEKYINASNNNIEIHYDKINMINELNNIIKDKKFNVNSYLKKDYENYELNIDEFILNNIDYNYNYFLSNLN